MNISFAGCGFQGMYHMGAVSCLQRHGKGILKGIQGFGGASAGALVAALLVTKTPLANGVQFTIDLTSKVRKHFLGALHPSFHLMQHLEDGLHNFLPENAHEQASGKLYVSLSSYPQCENVIVSEFDSRNELIQVLLASCYIPLYGGMSVPLYRGEKWLDGGFSDNLPMFESGRTIRVSPFSGDFDICPDDKHSYKWFKTQLGKNMDVLVNLKNVERGFQALFPPSEKELQRVYRCGYNDALRFLGVRVSK